MKKRFIKTFIISLILNLACLICQKFVLNSIENETTAGEINLIFSYCLNFGISLTVILIIFALKKKYESQIGFIFLAISSIKIIALYLLLIPSNIEKDLSKIDSFAILIPFLVNLVVELTAISQVLKLLDLTDIAKKK